MRGFFLACLISVALVCVEAQQKPFFATFEYATPYPLGAAPFGSYYYVAYLCNQSLYAGKLVTLSVNLPYANWDWDSLNVVFVNIYAQQGEQAADLVASNVGSDGRPNSTVSWIYNATRGDSNLWVVYSVQGVITTLTFTSTLDFDEAKADYVQAPFIYKMVNRKTLPAATYIAYREIIKGDMRYTVGTGPSSKPLPTLIDFSYCPPPNTVTYTLIVQVVAADTKSAMSLYICTPDKLPCSASNSARERQDPAGIAVATVILPTTTRQFTFLEAAVYGVGAYEGINTFYFVVSTTPTNGTKVY